MKVQACMIALLLFATGAYGKKLCTGFLPENNLKIPVGFHLLDDTTPTGITHDQFNTVLDQVDKYMRPIITRHGGNFVVNRNWDDATVNAYAHQDGNDWVIEMFGGLARYPTMTPDGFIVVACHESGHHLGGAPIARDFGRTWASNEGEADYFSTSKCVKEVFQPADNAAFVKTHAIDPVAAKQCQATYTNVDDQNLCQRTAMAAMTLAGILHTLKKEPTPPRFDTPDPNVVSDTFDQHPEAQCRLDTYFQGGLCTKAFTDEFSNNDAEVGACTEKQGFKVGMRPHCWFNPDSKPGDGGGDGSPFPFPFPMPSAAMN